MYYVYILKSVNKKWFYIGFTRTINFRIKQHNQGYVKSTKAHKPFELIFVQMAESSLNARKLEKYLKIRFNKEALLKII